MPWYPADDRCLVHKSIARDVAVAADMLPSQGQSLVFGIRYRPHDVSVRMFQLVPNRPGWLGPVVMPIVTQPAAQLT
jgi:D-alanyl-D-alanine dipeptidase